MPKVEMTINLGSIWDRYHAGETTPDDVRRLLLAYDGARTEREQLRRDNDDLSADLARALESARAAQSSRDQALAAAAAANRAARRAQAQLRAIADLHQRALTDRVFRKKYMEIVG